MAELYAILMVLRDFKEPLNIVTDLQYAERVVMNIETTEYIPDDTELASLYIRIQDTIRKGLCPTYIRHIMYHTNLLGSLA